MDEPNGEWTPTKDLEMCDDKDGKGAHFALRQPVDDEQPHCLIGGGELNMLAGLVLCQAHKPMFVVCEYGGRAPYLSSIGAPSGSEVVSTLFKSSLLPPYPEIVVWSRDRVVEDGKTNTERELQNILELANERGCTEIGLVTISVHYARSLLMAKRHLQKARFAPLRLQFFISEVVLTEKNSCWKKRTSKMLGSAAYLRTMFREQRDINAFLAGSY